MTDKQHNLIVLTYEAVHTMLGLDTDHKVIGVIVSPEDQMYNRMEIIISGPTCYLVPEGTPMPCVYIKDCKVDYGLL